MIHETLEQKISRLGLVSHAETIQRRKPDTEKINQRGETRSPNGSVADEKDITPRIEVIPAKGSFVINKLPSRSSQSVSAARWAPAAVRTLDSVIQPSCVFNPALRAIAN